MLKEYKGIDNFEIAYKKDELEEKTYENICILSYFYSIIEKYWKKYNISQAYIEHKFRVPVYRLFYEGFYFEICKINYLEGYVAVWATEKEQKGIKYKDIMEDKKTKDHKEKEEFIKKFHNQMRRSKEKAEELDIDLECLKEIVKDEFEI